MKWFQKLIPNKGWRRVVLLVCAVFGLAMGSVNAIIDADDFLQVVGFVVGASLYGFLVSFILIIGFYAIFKGIRSWLRKGFKEGADYVDCSQELMLSSLLAHVESFYYCGPSFPSHFDLQHYEVFQTTPSSCRDKLLVLLCLLRSPTRTRTWI